MKNDPSDQSLHEDIDFLFEFGTLRHIERAWKQFGGLDFANVTEHTARVALIAMILAKREGADIGRTLMLALCHDVPEIRTGDANYVQRQYRSDDDDLAKLDIAAKTSISELIRSLFSEYSEGASLEARIVKDADSLDCDFELIERKDSGANIATLLEQTREAVGSRLRTASGRAMIQALKEHSSHDWHLKTRNRLNAGDWRSGSDE